MHCITALAFIVSQILLAQQAYAQDAAPALDGLASLHQAAQHLKNSAVWGAARGTTETTLTQKRAALADPNVQRALALLQQALALPMRFSEDDPGFAYQGDAREMARLLVVEQEVAFADGQPRAALEALRQGLLLGYVVKADRLIGYDVGIDIDQTLMEIADHFDQLSLRDCNLMIALMQQNAARQDPFPLAIRAEAEDSARMLTTPLRDSAAHGFSPDELRSLASSFPAERETLLTMGNSDPGALTRLILTITNGMDSVYQEANEAYQRTGAVTLPPPGNGQTPAERISATMAMPVRRSLVSADEKGKENLALLRMLTVHAALRRYHWENDRYPDSLSALNLGNMIRDPMTNNAFAYFPLQEGASYWMEAAGRPERDDRGRLTGRRNPPLFLPLHANRPTGLPEPPMETSGQ